MNPKYLLIIEMLAHGMGPKQIGDRLNLKSQTVDSYKVRIYDIYGVKNVAHLISYCYKNGILK